MKSRLANIMPRFPRRIKCLKILVRWKNDPLLARYPAKLSKAIRQPTRNCLGYRPYDKETKTYGPYQWMTYADVQIRRGNFGVGIVEVNKRAGILQPKYGVGLWCQNRPEWQLTGRYTHEFTCLHKYVLLLADQKTLFPRFGLHVTVALHGVSI